MGRGQFRHMGPSGPLYTFAFYSVGNGKLSMVLSKEMTGADLLLKARSEILCGEGTGERQEVEVGNVKRLLQ